MSNETERTLHELKLPGMASCWSSLEETHQLDKLTLREGMQIMLQYERDTRGNNRIQRLIKNAGFQDTFRTSILPSIRSVTPDA